MKVIGLSGKRGVGKTLAAKYLEKNYGYHRVSFAEELRLLAKTVFPFNDLDLSDPRRKEAKFRAYEWTPRDFLIHLGEFCRYHDSDYWVKRLLNKLKSDEKYVIDDVRYLNEAGLLVNNGHTLIRLDRYHHLNPYGAPLDIPSEKELDTYEGFKYKINEVQNLSVRSLTDTLDAIMRELENV